MYFAAGTPAAPPHTGGLLAVVGGTTGLLTVAVLGIALLLFLIIKVRLQPFVALLGVSIAVGLGAGLSVTELFGTVQKSSSVSMIESGMGGILGHIAIIIGLGTMLGSILEVSGGAEVLSARLLKLFGEKRAPLAMGLTGLIFGIPIFFDVGIFVLAPIVYAAAKRSGKSIVLYAMPLLAGLSMTHAFLPPHPGPVAAAALFHVSLGWVILIGAACGIPAVLAAWVYAAWIGKRLFVPVPQDMVEAAAEAKAAVVAEQRALGVKPQEKPVPLGTVLAIIGTPLILILLATFSSIALDPSTLRSVLEFFGHPFVALTIALFLSYYLLGIRRGWSRKSLEAVSTASLKPVGNILLVVGAAWHLRRRPQRQRHRGRTVQDLQRRGSAGHRAGVPDLAGAAGGPGQRDGGDRDHGGHRPAAGRRPAPLTAAPRPDHHGHLGRLDLRLARQRRRILDGRQVLRHLGTGHAEVLDGTGIGPVGGGLRGRRGAQPGDLGGPRLTRPLLSRAGRSEVSEAEAGRTS